MVFPFLFSHSTNILAQLRIAKFRAFDHCEWVKTLSLSTVCWVLTTSESMLPLFSPKYFAKSAKQSSVYDSDFISVTRDEISRNKMKNEEKKNEK